MAIKNRQKHIARSVDYKENGQDIISLPRDNLLRRVMLDFEIVLDTGATAGSAAKEDDLLNLVPRIEVRQNGADHLFDVDLRTYAKVLRFEYGCEIDREDLSIPTANQSATMHVRVPIDFAITRNALSDYRALVPAPILDSLELLITWADISKVLGTVGNTTVSSSTKCNVSVVEVYGTAESDQEAIQGFIANREDIREGVEQLEVDAAHTSYPAEALPLVIKPEPARHLAHLLVAIEDSGAEGDREFKDDIITQIALDNVKGAGESILYDYWVDMHGQQKLDYGLEADNPTGCLYIDWVDQRNGGLDNIGVDALKWRFLTNAPASGETDAVRIYKKYIPLKRA